VFTKETESDGVLAFLDVKLTRENTGAIWTMLFTENQLTQTDI